MRPQPALFALTIALLASLLSPNASKACDGGFGYGFGIGQLYNSLEYRVPYFAAHPPVYYSHPVPRTYGHSPFAYPPHFRTPELASPMQPVMISNPHVRKAIKTKKRVKPTERTVSHGSASESAGPLVIVNPFVAETKLASAAR